MSKFLSNIGPSDELRKLVAESEEFGTSIPLILDEPRTLTIVSTARGRTELIVRCKDSATTVVLHLPYADNAVGQATIISYGKES